MVVGDAVLAGRNAFGAAAGNPTSVLVAVGLRLRRQSIRAIRDGAAVEVAVPLGRAGSLRAWRLSALVSQTELGVATVGVGQDLHARADLARVSATEPGVAATIR